MKEILTAVPESKAMHRFNVPVLEDDFFQNGSDIAYYPDPSDEMVWTNRKVPRRGISFFCPNPPNESQGTPRMLAAVPDIMCTILGEKQLTNGYRLVFDRTMTFALRAGGTSTIDHYLMYSSTSKTVDQFKDAPNQFTWIPCTLMAADEQFTILSDFESEQGQASSTGVVTLRLLKDLWHSGALNPMEQLIVTDLHTDIAMKKKPLRYLQIGRAQALHDILSGHAHDIASARQDQREDVMREVTQIIRWKGFSANDNSCLTAAEMEAITEFESEDDQYSDDDEEPELCPVQQSTPGASE